MPLLDPELEPKTNDLAQQCEVCHGTGFVAKMADVPGELEGEAVEPCPICNGTGQKGKG